jgi:hypothetical protein
MTTRPILQQILKGILYRDEEESHIHKTSGKNKFHERIR